MNTSEFIAAWDAGQPVRTIEMGGLGDDYELAIQTMAIEFLREFEKNPFDYENDGHDRDKWSEYVEGVEKVPSVKATIDHIAPTGMMWGSAVNMASVINKHGYEKAMTMVSEDRIITVVKGSFDIDGNGTE